MAQKQNKQAESEPSDLQRKVLEERYMALKMLDAQIKQGQQQLMLIEQQAGELQNTREALDELANIKPGTEILVPVATGLFAKATISETQKLIVNVGSSTSSTKPLADVKKIIDEQTVELRKAEEEISAQMQHMAAQAQMIEQEMSSIL